MQNEDSSTLPERDEGRGIVYLMRALRLIRARMKVNAKPTKQAPEIAKKPCLKTPVESFSAPRR
jgi:hypothetical protein